MSMGPLNSGRTSVLVLISGVVPPRFRGGRAASHRYTGRPRRVIARQEKPGKTTAVSRTFSLAVRSFKHQRETTRRDRRTNLSKISLFDNQANTEVPMT